MAHLHQQLRHLLSALIAACGLLAALPASAGQWDFGLYASCLLYTSDAADE